MVIRCTNCAEPIEVPDGGRLPPWCLKCGATLSNVTTTASAPPAARAAQNGPAALASVADTVGAGRDTHRCSAEDFDDTQAIAVFDFSLWGYVHKVGPGFLLVGIFAALAAGGLLLDLTRPNAGTTMPSLIMAGIAVGFLVYSFAAYGRCIRRVEVFADGIRWFGPQGTGRFAWENVEAVYRSEIVLNGFLVSELKLVGRNGREVTFDLTLERFKEFADLVQRRSAESIRPRKRAEAEAYAAAFGPVYVGPGGVTVEGCLFPWEYVARYSVARGRLHLQLLGHGSKAVPLHVIPNYLVLLYLMEEFSTPTREASGHAAMAC
jgi:hypothetical protein